MPDARTPTPPYPHGALPIGTRLGEFEVRRVLGVGGFGIVYLAFDHLLEREVALKEYMPSALADRNETMHVSLISQANADTFALGLRSFVNEARLLARFDHPSLVKVHRFWEANGTAYMAMALYKGRTVRDVRLEMRQQPDEAWVRRILEPLLGAVEKLHSEDIYHRDIAPDNILLEGDGRPVLLDFGAARRVISDRSQALTAILKPSYAPIEQYADVGGMKQGAWTDIYALGATMHFLLLGRPPPPAPGRSIQDMMPSLASQQLPGCSPGFLDLIDWMLTPMPTERPQSVAAIREVLAGRAQAPRKGAPAEADIPLDADLTLPLGTPAPLQGATQVVPRPKTSYTPASEDATVIVPRSGNTGYDPSARVSPTPPPPAPGTAAAAAAGRRRGRHGRHRLSHRLPDAAPHPGAAAARAGALARGGWPWRRWPDGAPVGQSAPPGARQEPDRARAGRRGGGGADRRRPVVVPHAAGIAAGSGRARVGGQPGAGPDACSGPGAFAGTGDASRPDLDARAGSTGGHDALAGTGTGTSTGTGHPTAGGAAAGGQADPGPRAKAVARQAGRLVNARAHAGHGGARANASARSRPRAGPGPRAGACPRAHAGGGGTVGACSASVPQRALRQRAAAGAADLHRPRVQPARAHQAPRVHQAARRPVEPPPVRRQLKRRRPPSPRSRSGKRWLRWRRRRRNTGLPSDGVRPCPIPCPAAACCRTAPTMTCGRPGCRRRW
ncbi:MAG: protein kinase [Rubrivivax sp.]